MLASFIVLIFMLIISVALFFIFPPVGVMFSLLTLTLLKTIFKRK